MSSLSERAQKEMNSALKKSESVQEALDILSQYYELENVRLGLITKGVLIGKLEKLAKDLKAKPRPEYRSGNIDNKYSLR